MLVACGFIVIRIAVRSVGSSMGVCFIVRSILPRSLREGTRTREMEKSEKRNDRVMLRTSTYLGVILTRQRQLSQVGVQDEIFQID